MCAEKQLFPWRQKTQRKLLVELNNNENRLCIDYLMHLLFQKKRRMTNITIKNEGKKKSNKFDIKENNYSCERKYMCNGKWKQRKEGNKNKWIMHRLYMEQQRMNEKKIIRKRKCRNMHVVSKRG